MSAEAPNRERYELPSVEVPSLEGLRVELPSPTPPDAEDLLHRLHQRLRESVARTERAPGDAIEVGDEVECDIVTVVNGQVLPGSVRQAASLEVREFPHLPGLSEALLSMTTFSAKTIELTLPDDYPEPSVAGQVASIYLEVRRVFALDDHSLDSPVALGAAGLGDSVEGALAVMAEEIDAEQGEQLLLEATQVVLEAFADRVEAEIPAAAINEELHQTWMRTEGALLSQKSFPPEFLTQAESDFLSHPKLRAEASHRIKLGLALGALIEQESLEPSDEVLQTLLEVAATQAGVTVEQAKKELTSNPLWLQEAGQTALRQTAVEFVMARAIIDIPEAEPANS